MEGMERIIDKILATLTTLQGKIVLCVFTVIGTVRIIYDLFSSCFRNFKEKKMLHEIKNKIDKIELKDHNLQKLNDNIDEIITKIYKELFIYLGIDRDTIKSLVRKHLFNKKINELKDPLRELILLLARCTYKFDRKVTYGNETPINTKYYINTMSITHNEYSGIKMCILLGKLIEQKGFHSIDFIITPKSGNPILAHKFASMFNTSVLLHKSENESSAVKLSPDEHEKILQVYYEGFDQLKSLIDKSSSKKIRGVALDCNTSGGKNLLKAVEDFNIHIEKVPLGQKIEKVTKAFVLFRAEAPPDSEHDIDKKFKEKGIEIIRYFDCNEKIKEDLAELAKLPDSSPESEKKVKDIIKTLNDNNLIKIKIKI